MHAETLPLWEIDSLVVRTLDSEKKLLIMNVISVCFSYSINNIKSETHNSMNWTTFFSTKPTKINHFKKLNFKLHMKSTVVSIGYRRNWYVLVQSISFNMISCLLKAKRSASILARDMNFKLASLYCLKHEIGKKYVSFTCIICHFDQFHRQLKQFI